MTWTVTLRGRRGTYGIGLVLAFSALAEKNLIKENYGNKCCFFLFLVAKTHAGDNSSEISSLPMRFIYESRNKYFTYLPRNISAFCKYMHSQS